MTITTEQLAEILSMWYADNDTLALPHFIARELCRLDPNFSPRQFVEATGEPFDGRGSRNA